MTIGEYIDSLLEENDTLKNERDLYQNECEHILKVTFTAIELLSYINLWGVFNYLEAIYPNRYKRKMDSFNAQDD